MRRSGRWAAAALSVAVMVLCGCVPRMPGLVKKDLARGRTHRTYRLHVPPSYDGSKPVPLVMALHGLTESGTIMADLTGFDALADREGFIVVYPDGLWRHWNSFSDAGLDDFGFLVAVVKELQGAYSIDPDRIYVTGDSNGGFMTFCLMCRAPDVFAAAAPVMATMPHWLTVKYPPSRAVPLLLIHGTEDPIVPYGEAESASRLRRQRGIGGIPGTVDFWVRANGCDAEPARDDVPDANPNDRTTTVRETYTGGRDGAEVILYRVRGGGHTWPGSARYMPRFVVGRKSMDFNASEVIWEFFTRHPMKRAAKP